jgi:phosphoglycolate phosphatase
MKSSLVIFDLDGTLLDSRADLVTGVNLSRADYGLEPLPFQTVVDFIGNGFDVLFARSFQGAGLSAEEALESLKVHYRNHMFDESQLYPGTEDVLEQLHVAGVQMAVVTNKTHEHAVQLIEHFGLSGYFRHILGDMPGLQLKPNPEPLHRVFEALSHDATNAWMGGDNHTDLAAGRAAGTRTCYCAYGFGNPRECEYDVRIDAISEFLTCMN